MKRLYIVLIIILSFVIIIRTPLMVYATTSNDSIKNSIVLHIGKSYAIVNNVDTLIDKHNKKVKPILKNSRTLIPLRFISESFGAEVTWDGDTSTVTITINEDIVTFVIGNKLMTINGQNKDLDIAAEILNGRTYVPLRAIGEAFGKRVFYDSNIIIITDKSYYDGKIVDDLISYFEFIEVKHIAKKSLLLQLGTPYAFIDGIHTLIDTENFEITPLLKNSRTFVPIRFISEGIGAKVNWDGSTSTVSIHLNDDLLKFIIGQKTMTVNGEERKLDAATQIYNNRAYVPLRAIAEAFGKKVFYDSGIIIVSDKEEIIETNSEGHLIDEIKEYFNFKRKENMYLLSKNSPNNNINNNLAVKQEEWIYYSDYPYNGLWKMKEDGSSKTKLTDGSVRYITVVDVWIYYADLNTIYKIKIDGSNKTALYKDNYSLHQIHYIDDTLYYLNNQWGIQKMGIDGKQLYQNSPHLAGNEVDISIINNNIYYRNAADDYTIYKKDLSTDLSTNKYTKLNEHQSGYINIMDGYIYYSNQSDNDKLYKIKDSDDIVKLDYTKALFSDTYVIVNPEIRKINDDESLFINAYDGWIYYSNFSDDGKLYKIKPDGSSRTRLNDEFSADINVIGDWIYYFNKPNMYRIKTDGTQREKL